MRARWGVALAALGLVACGGERDGTEAGLPYETLSEYGLFEDTVAQRPAAGVVPYEVTSVLFADEAHKSRFLALPEGATVPYQDTGIWDFPEGTILVKTFWYPEDARAPEGPRRLLETRLILHTPEGWRGETYVWDEAQTEARHVTTGRTLPVTWTDEAGTARALDYRVPNNNDCLRCHSHQKVFEPLGPRTPYLNRDHDYGAGPENQIDHLRALGWVVGEVPPAGERTTLVHPFDAGAPLEGRARAYLDANCAHCHRPGGFAAASGLDLRFDTPFGAALGVCKTPVAPGRGGGGRRYTLVPGDPDASILVFRMASIDPDIKMPELPTMTSDPAGVALVSEWIAAMPAQSCDAP